MPVEAGKVLGDDDLQQGEDDKRRAREGAPSGLRLKDGGRWLLRAALRKARAGRQGRREEGKEGGGGGESRHLRCGVHPD